ncbi:MAG TPA: aminotransferase class V-fold PLP-dependent enzyme [Flavihumibacter sp.]|nr:aminotransferase class V-fold PLP-dependent enzyme [Flavihumibacter sp.]
MNRREILKNISVLSLTGGVAGAMLPLSEATAAPAAPKRDLFKELGVTPVINASVTMTFLSGSLMLPEVLEAIESVAHDFANMHELQDKVGAKIADMLKVEGAMVTSGAACAMLLGTAACITGTDAEKIKRIPNLPGPRPEVIMQKSHRYLFDQAITTTGANIIEVDGLDAMDKAFNNNTVMALFFNAAGESSVTREQFVALCKKHKVPSFIDAAADVPPVGNLFKFQQMGFDLITFSGGKMIRGPQSAGLLFGRKDLIEAAKLNHSPHEAPIGRPMKVNKEEIFGMYVALKAYLERDHDKEWKDWLQRTQRVKSIVETVPGVKGENYIDPGPANNFPSLDISWDETKLKTTPQQVYEKLKNDNPSIVTNVAHKNGKSYLRVGVVLLKPEQVEYVANKVKGHFLNP